MSSQRSTDNSGNGNSRAIVDAQQHLHNKLEETVTKHLQQPFRKPVAEFNRSAFARAEDFIKQHANAALILDSGCGVGASTNRIALTHPDAIVIGIDQSSHRLDKHQAHRLNPCDNYLLLRADLVDFWRLAEQAGWQLFKHYVLYPNPWPKSKHLQRRWHGSAVFPSIVKLGGLLELRSNWKLYLEEFQSALTIAGEQATLAQLPQNELSEPLTPFEQKYYNSGQPLYRLQCTLSKRN